MLKKLLILLRLIFRREIADEITTEGGIIITYDEDN